MSWGGSLLSVVREILDQVGEHAALVFSFVVESLEFGLVDIGLVE